MNVLFLTIWLAATGVDSAQVVATRLDGSVLEGQIVAWNANGVEIQGDEQSAKIPAQELLNIRFSTADTDRDDSAMFLELVDGSRFLVSDFTTQNRVATVATPYADQPVKIRTDQIRSINLLPRTESADAVWQELQDKELADDVLIVAKRDGASFDYLTGVVGDVAADQARFEWEGERVDVKRSKVAGIIFFHKQSAAARDPACQLTTVDGSQFNARTIELDGDRLKLMTPAGLAIETDLSRLRLADFSFGKLSYLSDLKPIEVAWTPRIGVAASSGPFAAYGQPRYDQSYSGSALALLWKDDPLPSRRDLRVYAKGLAIRSRTELTWRLPEGMQRFSATAGIDPQTASQGRVYLQIRGDGQMLWEGPINGQDPPTPIEAPLKGARRLQLTVDYGENLDYGDRLHLVEARVTK